MRYLRAPAMRAVEKPTVAFVGTAWVNPPSRKAAAGSACRPAEVPAQIAAPVHMPRPLHRLPAACGLRIHALPVVVPTAVGTIRASRPAHRRPKRRSLHRLAACNRATCNPPSPTFCRHCFYWYFLEIGCTGCTEGTEPISARVCGPNNQLRNPCN